jgi:hypothetical protein
MGPCDESKCPALCRHKPCSNDYVVTAAVDGNSTENGLTCRCLDPSSSLCGSNQKCVSGECTFTTVPPVLMEIMNASSSDVSRFLEQNGTVKNELLFFTNEVRGILSGFGSLGTKLTRNVTDRDILLVLTPASAIHSNRGPIGNNSRFMASTKTFAECLQENALDLIQIALDNVARRRRLSESDALTERSLLLSINQEIVAQIFSKSIEKLMPMIADKVDRQIVSDFASE